LNPDTPDALAVGSGYCEVADSSWATICWAFWVPAETAVPGELLLAAEVVEPPEELHAARAADTVIIAAEDSHHLPGSLIAHASKRLEFTTVT